MILKDLKNMQAMTEHIDVPGSQVKIIARQFFRTAAALILHRKLFFEELAEGKEFFPPLIFLLANSLVFTALSSFFAVRQQAFFAVIFFINSFCMPFITAGLLYVITLVLCRHAFTVRTLFAITAYAKVTLLIAWIPGISFITELYSFYLIWLGMIKQGRIGRVKAGVCLGTALIVMLFLIQATQSLWNA
jgi:hypothetical protein